jgi:hypothetical protein
MPHLTLPILPGGLLLDVVIGLPSGAIAGMQSAGTPIPPPLRLRALLDTAADLTAVAPAVAQQLGLPGAGSTSTHTAGGLQAVQLFRASLSIPGAAGMIFVRSDLLVMELAHPLPNAEVLIGMDVLTEGLLISDGPGRQFILGF